MPRAIDTEPQFNYPRQVVSSNGDAIHVDYPRRSAMRHAQDAAAEPIRDKHIRAALVAYLREKDSAACIFHELPLSRGERRADIVSVNGSLAGYEIKSDGDSLARLSDQAQTYAAVFEYMTLVVARRHIAGVRRLVPRQWGIMEVVSSSLGVHFKHVRKPSQNRSIDCKVLLRLLWKDECLRILKAHGERADRNSPIIEIWSRLEKMPACALLADVRNALKARGGSEFGRRQAPNGG